MPDQLVEAGAEVVEQVFEFRILFVGQFQDRLAFPGRSQRDVEEPHLFAPGSLAASFRQIECDRERGPLEMISCAAFEPEAAGFAVELFCELESSSPTLPSSRQQRAAEWTGAHISTDVTH